MNDCLNFLNEHPEWPGDQVLAAQVRIHLLIDQLASDGSVMPPYYHLAALSSPIDAVKNQLPPGLEDNGASRSASLFNVEFRLTDLSHFQTWLAYNCSTVNSPS